MSKNEIEQLSQRIADLRRKQEQIENDPASKAGASGIWKYNKRARSKLDKLAWDIADCIRQKRLLTGEVLNDAGYSGRQTNRR